MNAIFASALNAANKKDHHVRIARKAGWQYIAAVGAHGNAFWKVQGHRTLRPAGILSRVVPAQGFSRGKVGHFVVLHTRNQVERTGGLVETPQAAQSKKGLTGTR